MIKLVVFVFSLKALRLFFLVILPLFTACSQTKPRLDIVHQTSHKVSIPKEYDEQYHRFNLAKKQQSRLKDKLLKLETEMLKTAEIISKLGQDKNTRTHIEIYVARLEAMNKSRIALLNRVAYWRVVIDNYPD